MRNRFTDAIGAYLRDESGISASIVALSVVFLTGMAGLSVDLGYAYTARVKLQAATNAAALAGAYYIGSTTDPVPVARLYSAGQGDQNAKGNGFLTTMTSGTLLCLSTFKASNPCLGSGSDYPSGGANAIRVVETGRSPTFFAGLFGVKYFAMSATATATSHGGSGKPLDVAIILDTTASMGSTDSTCGLGASSTREQCAESGITALLLNMSQSMAKVQLLAFPGFPSQAQGNVDWACPKSGTPTIVPYWTSNIVYTVTPGLEQDYQNTSSSPVTLNQNADIVKAIGGNTSCSQGVQTPGGEGTYYAGAISAAQALLAADGDSPAAYQQVIILLSDGEANSCNNEVASIPVNNPGQGYKAPPTVTVSLPNSNVCSEGGGPVQATGTAVMAGTSPNMTVSSITVKNAGNDYYFNSGTSTPAQTVTLSAPTGTSPITATASLTLSSAPGVNQCTQAVNAATAAKAAGTQIYVIAYGSSTSTSDCTTDFSPSIAPCTALADIASDTTAGDSVAFFYSDGSGGVTCPTATSVTNLATAGALIAEAVTKVRLVPNTTV
jgi:hypothetical protein